MVKRLRNWLNIGLQAGFGPNFTVELEAEIPKNLGWPNVESTNEKGFLDNDLGEKYGAVQLI